ncbi:hypothetical protein GCM10011517_06200 [Actibacterium pelagium]|uniref:Uncharacterized protein n=1 Tax=Actibacterium pelagium TaxID=2029103 RepID=A0A917AC69_9RHOB|nr:hypothetical protein GCM10011517_06200 [Actibacterium pelagium]
MSDMFKRGRAGQTGPATRLGQIAGEACPLSQDSGGALQWGRITGTYLGRRATIDTKRSKQLLNDGMNISAREMGISRQSVYRLKA